MNTKTMKAMNDYVICSEVSEENEIIEMPEGTKESVKAARPITTTEKVTAEILADLPEGIILSDLTIYFRAAEGMMFPDEEYIAVPLKAIIAVARA